MYMRNSSFIGTLLSILIFFFVIRFAFRLLPYILIGYLIWYFYRKLIKPFFNRGQERNAYQSRTNYQRDTNTKTEQEDPLINQVKSVHDDQFFKQDHKVIDVDFDDKEK